jgi:glyoxylase-like metal-dependent hydrolase (beta-lactamase superfamily II)
MVIPEMTPAELVSGLEAGKEIHVLDIRTPHQLESGRIDILPADWFHNIPVAELLHEADANAIELDPEKNYAVVCTRGNDSLKVADYLNHHGFHAASVAGGMLSWMSTTLPRELDPPGGLDRLVQFDRVGKGALGYVLISDGEALVIDPPRHTLAYLELVDAADAKVVGVADTHAHADYVSGGPNLALALDAPYCLHPMDAVYPYDGTPGKVRYQPLDVGATIRVGRASVTVEHTPGHTEGSVTFRIGDDAALTGDFIFIESVGRPDLGERTEEWTDVLFQSLERARNRWPGSMRIHPAHYAAASERNEDHTIGRAFGDLRDSNAPLGLSDAQEFSKWVLSRTGEFPEAYRTIKSINVGLHVADETEIDELENGRNECALT